MSEGIEARLTAAAGAGDDEAFDAALREATFHYPVLDNRAASTWSPLEVRGGEVLCTSRELALQAIRRARGDASGWRVRRLSVDEATELLHDVSPVVLNPGTPMQRDLSIPRLMKRWRRAGIPSRPRERELAPRSAAWAMLFAVGCLVVALMMFNSPPTCNGQSMSPGDRCRSVSDSGGFTLDADEVSASNTRLGLIFGGVGVLLAGFAVQRLYVGIASRAALRRYEREQA